MDTQIEYKFHTTKELDGEEHTFEVVLERYPDGRYYIYCPSLKGCRTWGHSEKEAQEYMQEALELYIEDLIADGKPIPGIGIVENIKPMIKEVNFDVRSIEFRACREFSFTTTNLR